MDSGRREVPRLVEGSFGLAVDASAIVCMHYAAFAMLAAVFAEEVLRTALTVAGHESRMLDRW